jgi:hypothetical protein
VIVESYNFVTNAAQRILYNMCLVCIHVQATSAPLQLITLCITKHWHSIINTLAAVYVIITYVACRLKRTCKAHAYAAVQLPCLTVTVDRPHSVSMAADFDSSGCSSTCTNVPKLVLSRSLQ